LFGDPSAAHKQAAPATPPAAAPAAADDLFGDPAAAPKPAAMPASATPPAAAPADDLFGTPPAAAPATPAPAPATAPADDPFAPPSNDKVTSRAYRLWVDDTGTFQVRAKLVVVLDGKVRLLKENGKFTTVPLERLSKADLQFVVEQSAIAALGQK
jgi:hypothetical protein